MSEIERNERLLWAGLIEGNRDSFEKIYQQYFKFLYSYGRKICHNSVEVEDAIHDLFISLWKYHGNLSPTSSIRFYLFRALRRRIVENGSKNIEATVFKGNFTDFHSPENSTIEDVLIHSEREDERIRTLRRNLNHLSPRQYEALMLRFYGDLSYEEVGGILEVNEQSARNLVQRGLEQLRNFANILKLLTIASIVLPEVMV